MDISYVHIKIKLLLIIILSFALYNCEDKNDGESEGLIINEFLAKNNACCTDENGEYDDWVEIYNRTDAPINIGGMYFSDRQDDPDPYKIPKTDASMTTVPTDRYLVLWCDGQPEQGILHLDLKLSGDGESVVLIDKDGITIIDSYTFGPQTSDVSMGRNGSGDSWVFFNQPTPGISNL